MQSEAENKLLLPLKRPDLSMVPSDVYQEEFFLIPSAKEAVDTIIPNYITGFVYGALVEAFCSEQNARMMAMQSATDNADSLLHDLSIMYNRARQAAITQEITEVCSGARAQKKKKEMHV
jgi:F-type H+-transporting ATPase subunit gamma